jgi:hypothetical protein
MVEISVRKKLAKEKTLLFEKTARGIYLFQTFCVIEP